MKLSENTLSVLKNFATINTSIILKPGRKQRIYDSSSKAVLGEVILEENIPCEFGIYDLNRFIGLVTTLENPNLTFVENEHVIVDDDELYFKYHKCHANLIVPAPEKDLKMDKIIANFTLKNAMLQKLVKVATMNNLPHISLVGKEGGLYFKIHDRSVDTSDEGSIRLGDYAGDDFIASFKRENLKILPDDYTVEVGAFAKFENTAGNLKYWIAVDSK